MKLGSIVELRYGPKANRPHVVVHEPLLGRVQLCYCGASLWYAPKWHPAAGVTPNVTDSAQLRRCQRLLAAVRPDPDGWKRIVAGRHDQKVIVGHVDVPWSWEPS